MQQQNMLRLSPTGIATYGQCQRKFYYRHIEKLPEKPSPHQVRGRIIHKTLEQFFDFVDLEKLKHRKHWHGQWEEFRKIMFELFDAEWQKIGKSGTGYEDCFASEEEKKGFHEESHEFLDFYAAKLAYALFNKLKELDSDSEWFEANVKRHFYPRDREMKIELIDENLVGFIDKTVSLFGKGIGIVDYKTSKSQLPHTIAESDLKQCKAYAYLWTNKFGEMPKFISIFYLRDGESVYYPIGEKDLAEIKSDIADIRSKKAEKENFPMKPSKLCEYCDFFKLCYASREEFEGMLARQKEKNS